MTPWVRSGGAIGLTTTGESEAMQELGTWLGG
jgi:hypothetical protein